MNDLENLPHRSQLLLWDCSDRELTLQCLDCTWRSHVYFVREIPDWWPRLLDAAISHPIDCVNLSSELFIGG